MNQNNLPRGIRNNNPANILRTGQRWLGLSKVQNDSRFCQFDDMKFGVRAFFILARTYRKKYGIISVRGFIERFAPYSENNVDAYVHYIRSNHYFKNGLLSSDRDYVHFLYWIIRYENHLTPVDMYSLKLFAFQLDDIRKEFNIKIC